MAWSEKLSSGRYRGVYRDRAGRRHRLPDTYTQAAEAKRAATRQEDAVRRRPEWEKRAGRTTWGEWCRTWSASRDVEPGTARRDQSRIDAHIWPRWHGTELAAIDRDAVQDWVDGLTMTPRTKAAPAGAGTACGGGQYRVETDETLSASTIVRAYRVFSASMTAAVVAGRITASPCVRIQLPKLAPPDERFLTRPQVAAMRTAAPDELAALVLALGVGTGARWGELVGLHRERIDLENRQITIQEVYDGGVGDIKPYPKGRNRRGVPITDELAEHLEAWMASHPAMSCRTPHRKSKSCRGTLLFCAEGGGPLNYSNFRRDRWDPMVAAIAVDATPHDMRHTYASWLVQDGVKLEQVQALLGHKSITTTQRYSHLADTQWKAVRAALGTDAATKLDEQALRERIAQLAAERPEWAAAAEALAGGTGEGGRNVAPDLPHDDDPDDHGKIIQLDRFRRSTGS